MIKKVIFFFAKRGTITIINPTQTPNAIPPNSILKVLPTGKRNFHFDNLRYFHPLDAFVVIGTG